MKIFEILTEELAVLSIYYKDIIRDADVNTPIGLHAFQFADKRKEYIKKHIKARLDGEKPVGYYKLTLRVGGSDGDIRHEYYKGLASMMDQVYHYGVNAFPCLESVDEITEQEYSDNELPF